MLNPEGLAEEISPDRWRGFVIVPFARLKILFSQCLASPSSPGDAVSVVIEVNNMGFICKNIIKLNNIFEESPIPPGINTVC